MPIPHGVSAPLASSANTHTLGSWMFLEMDRHTPQLALAPAVLCLDPSLPESFLVWDLCSSVPSYDGILTLRMTQPSPPTSTLAPFPAFALSIGLTIP